MKRLLPILFGFPARLSIFNHPCRSEFNLLQSRSLAIVGKQYIITEKSSFTETIKKSKFVATVYPVHGIENALATLSKVSDMKATHNCWAFNSIDYQRSSDDGEPSGTAGRPIFNALNAESIVNALVVVTRYYGGINLGTGGLTRAYGGTALQALKLAHKIEYIPRQGIIVHVPIRDVGAVHSVLKMFDINENKAAEYCSLLDKEVYVDMVTLDLSVPVSDVVTFQEKVSSLCVGRAKFVLR